MVHPQTPICSLQGAVSVGKGEKGAQMHIEISIWDPVISCLRKDQFVGQETKTAVNAVNNTMKKNLYEHV